MLNLLMHFYAVLAPEGNYWCPVKLFRAEEMAHQGKPVSARKDKNRNPPLARDAKWL